MLVLEKSRTRIAPRSKKLRGRAGATIGSDGEFYRFCEKHFHTFSRDRFEPVALRGYFKRHLLLTLYAIDREKWEKQGSPQDNIPVKKFRTTISSAHMLLDVMREFNFTLATNRYPIPSIRVTNK